MARGRPEKSLARFERIALVLSGGGALGAYQAGAYAALEKCGVRPNWIAGTAVGAINAAIIAGNLPHERVPRLRQFWRELSERAANQRSPARPMGEISAHEFPVGRPAFTDHCSRERGPGPVRRRIANPYRRDCRFRADQCGDRTGGVWRVEPRDGSRDVLRQ